MENKNKDYIYIKGISEEENTENIIKAAKAFAILIGAMFLAMYLFVQILLSLKDHNPLMAFADFLWIR